MEYCKSCIFYDEMYDNIRRSGNDVFEIGKNTLDMHFCMMYPNGIPKKIWEGMQDCKRRESMK